MNGSSRLLDYFVLEAGEYLSTLEQLVSAAAKPAMPQLLAAARGLRGSATMAAAHGVARIAGRLEAISAAVATGSLPWSSELQRALNSAVADLRALVMAVRTWGPDENRRVDVALAAIESYAPSDTAELPEDVVVPIADLFYADEGPHVMQAAASPRTSFEQRLRGKSIGTPASARPSLRGSALKSVLGDSISTMRSIEGGPPAALVPVETLLYRGERAVGRAEELRAGLRNGSIPGSRSLLEELCDLVALARTG